MAHNIISLIIDRSVINLPTIEKLVVEIYLLIGKNTESENDRMFRYFNEIHHRILVGKMELTSVS